MTLKKYRIRCLIQIALNYNVRLIYLVRVSSKVSKNNSRRSRMKTRSTPMIQQINYLLEASKELPSLHSQINLLTSTNINLTITF